MAEAEIIDELEAAHRDLRVQLDSGDSFGTIHSGTAWTKNQHLLVGADYDDTRRLVDEVHEQLRAMNDKTVTRYNDASHADVNDPKWRRLTYEERQDRDPAIEAVRRAIAAVRDDQAVPPAAAGPKTRTEKLQELGELIHEREELQASLSGPTADLTTAMRSWVYDRPRVLAWDRRTWRWVEGHSPEDLGFLARYVDDPRKETSTHAMPKFMDRRLEGLRKILDRL